MTTVPQQPLDTSPYMPQMLRDIAKACGFEAMLKLARFGKGRAIYIPKTAPANHPLVLAVGVAASDEMMKRFGGQEIRMPTGKAALRVLIAAEFIGKGRSANDLCVEVDCTHRQAMRLIARARTLIRLRQPPFYAVAVRHGYEDDGQLSLLEYGRRQR